MRRAHSYYIVLYYIATLGGSGAKVEQGRGDGHAVRVQFLE